MAFECATDKYWFSYVAATANGIYECWCLCEPATNGIDDTQPINFGIINNRAQQQRTAPSIINMCAESSGINAPMMRIGDAQINKEEGNNAFLQQMTIQTETDQANRRIGEGKEQSCKDIVIPENAIEQVGEDHFPLTIDQVDEHHWLFLLYIKSDQSKFEVRVSLQ